MYYIYVIVEADWGEPSKNLKAFGTADAANKFLKEMETKYPNRSYHLDDMEFLP